MERNYYVLTENVKEPKIIKLEVEPHLEGYITFNKSNLKNNIPKSLYKSLVKNGLYTTIERGLSNNDTRFSLHRLVSCLYSNILSLEVHHLKKDTKSTNNITNLLPVDKKTHYRLDNSENGYNESIVLQKEYKNKIYKEPKQTLANNESIILDILNYKNTGFTPKVIIKKLKNKLKATSIYTHIKTFFYSNLFIKWLNNVANKDFIELNEKFNKRWSKIIEFEQL